MVDPPDSSVRVVLHRGTHADQVAVTVGAIHAAHRRPQLGCTCRGDGEASALPGVGVMPLVCRHHLEGVRGMLEQIVLPVGRAVLDVADLLSNGNQRVTEPVQLLFRLALRRLDHHGARNREGDGRWMKAVVDDPLGDVLHLDPGGGLERTHIEDENHPLKIGRRKRRSKSALAEFRFYGDGLSDELMSAVTEDRMEDSLPEPSFHWVRGMESPTPEGFVTVQEAGAEVVMEFLRRAFRRALTEDEVSRYIGLFQGGIDSGLPFDVALQEPVAVALTSPSFLFRAEARIVWRDKARRPRESFDCTHGILFTELSPFTRKLIRRLGGTEDSAVIPPADAPLEGLIWDSDSDPDLQIMFQVERSPAGCLTAGESSRRAKAHRRANQQPRWPRQSQSQPKRSRSWPCLRTQVQ